MFISCDTECTGLDPYHGSKPYFVTITYEDQSQKYWEWDVDPLNREPVVVQSDLEEIELEFTKADGIIFQNALFDLKMLDTLNYDWGVWPWKRIHETTILAHMIASCQNKDLTTLAMNMLQVDIQHYDDEVELHTSKARRICRTKAFIADHGLWAIAKGGRPDMPSARDRCWKADMWLMRAMLKHAPEYVPDIDQYDSAEDHPWASCLEKYGNADSSVTISVFQHQRRIIEEQGRLGIYKERLKLLPIVYSMKENGVTVSKTRKRVIYKEYAQESDAIRKRCIKVADCPDLVDLPVNGRSNALDKAVFEKLKLPVVSRSKKTGKPSMNKASVEEWKGMLDPHSKAYYFIDNLGKYRQRKTALSYMKGYERYWLSLGGSDEWYVLHPNINICGTITLRCSSNNPNEQNISKKRGFNLRYCFGPSPGRLWASIDYENIELRIPAYESGEPELINLFENPTSPPYYGSVHLLNFSTVYPDRWKTAVGEAGEDGAASWIKAQWADSWYQRCKNGGFAVQYGSVDRGADAWSTADLAFGRQGSQALLKERFSLQEKLNQYWIEQANKTGYVETMPDLEVCPQHGYRIQCSRTKWDRVSPTIPLNYHVQGTACWVMMRAMIKVYKYLEKLNIGKPERDRWWITMQVHDELVVDFPNEPGYQTHVRNIIKLMESCGACINVPLTCSCKIHSESWAEGVSLEKVVQ